jgi:hypothetical protein
MWAILISLLWSTAFSKINEPGYNVSFPSAIAFNLIMASAIFKTPQIVRLLSGPGLSAFMGSLDGIQVGPVSVNPAAAGKTALFAATGYAVGGASYAASATMRAGQMAVARHRMMKEPEANREEVNQKVQKMYPTKKFKKAQIPNKYSPIR